MKNQCEIAQQLAGQLRPLEARSAINTEAKFRFVADVMAAAREGRFAHADAGPIIAKVRRHAELSAEADAVIVEAHAMMSDLAKQLELSPGAFGDWDQSMFAGAEVPTPLKVVA